jgi:hypothetical protein
MSELTRDAWVITLRQAEVHLTEIEAIAQHGTTPSATEYRTALVDPQRFMRDALAAKIAEMDQEATT